MDWKYWQYKIKDNIFYIIATLYAFYESHAYCGIYRLVSEKQLESSNKYSDQTSLLAALIVYIIIALAVKLLVERKFPQFNPEEDAPQETYAECKLRQAKLAAVIGAVLLIFGSLAVFAGSHFFSKPECEPFTIGSNTQPQSSWVDLKGLVQMDFAVRYSISKEKKSRKVKEQDYWIIPVTAPDWKEGQPFKYFIRINKMQLTDAENRVHNLKNGEKPFVVSFKGYVKKNGLEGMIQEDYKKNKIALENPYYVIDFEKPTDVFSLAEDWNFIMIIILLVFGGGALYLFALSKWYGKKAA
jgi:hypothetical protein